MAVNVTFQDSDGEEGLEARGRMSDAKNVRVIEPTKARQGKTVTLPPGAEWIASYVETLWKRIEKED